MSEQNKPRILITGATGYLAKCVVDRLSNDYQIVAVDFRLKPELGSDIPSYCVDYHKRGFADIFRNHTITGVIHLGRMLVHDGNPNNRYNANVIGTKRLLDLCVKYHIAPVVVLSTYHVYGATPYNPAPLDEEAPLKASELTHDLVDSVELENLANLYLWKYRKLHVTILRPCNIVGPGTRNTISQLLAQKFTPVMAGFSPMMQFIHVDDMADAIALAFRKNHPGIYNVAPEDWIPYQTAVEKCGSTAIPIPSIPNILPWTIGRLTGGLLFPSHLVNYFKYPVVIDGRLFGKKFGFKPQYSLDDIFQEYRQAKV